MVIHRGEYLAIISVPHCVGREVDLWVEKLLDDTAEDVCLDHCRDLVAKFELVDDLMDVRRKAVQIGLEVLSQLLVLRD